ncbi:zinc metalloprotease [Coemansia brasiliensis]|uniref:CAAX prenyl protease 1 homolog n=1 Tax=Coemansia brasiliensis TaxID=2650707 RepID=A0A9W8M1A2_9FUNG|nr:zinc metalloprotease [Coemansia brasiliensis]
MSDTEDKAPVVETSAPASKYGDNPNSAVDAQARIVQQKGVLDDVIDGVQLGLLVILFICLIFVAILGRSLPTVFPVTKPVYDFVLSLPETVGDLPQTLCAVWEMRPTNINELTETIRMLSEWLQEALHTLPYKQCVLGFSWSMYLLETKLNIRQRDRLHEVRRPKAISSFISRQVYLEANAYGLDKSSLQLVKDFVGQIQTTMIIVYDMIPQLWTAVGVQMNAWLGLDSDYAITQSVLFFIAVMMISTVLSLPFDLYATFVVEKRHGFNKQTMGLFFSDMVKSLVLTVVLGAPILAGFLWVIERTGSKFFLYAWALMALVQLLLIVIYPTLIQPLFNKFDPLPQGELRESIEALASRLKFPLKKLYMVDGSKRSSHSNAYVFGFFKAKRIVIYDTLIEQCTTDEIVAVVGHELGHWKQNHTLRMLVVAQFQILFIFFAFSCFIAEQSMYKSFGIDGMPVMLGFLFFQYLYEPLGSLMQFAVNVMSRKHEFEADAFSKNLGYGKSLASCLIKLQIENKATMNPDPIYSAYTYSHPPLVERLNALGNPHLASKKE